MKYCLVADDGEAQVVVGESDVLQNVIDYADYCSLSTCKISVPCKFHVCRREPSANGTKRIVIETWEKGVKLEHR